MIAQLAENGSCSCLSYLAERGCGNCADLIGEGMDAFEIVCDYIGKPFAALTVRSKININAAELSRKLFGGCV